MKLQIRFAAGVGKCGPIRRDVLLAVRLGILAAVLGGLAGLAHADSSPHADDLSEAKAHYERGFAAFGLGKYSTAAKEYEAAFELKSEPALLFDAAQAHRLAGNKERALFLYSSYLRLFPNVANRDNVAHFVTELKAAIEAENHAKGEPLAGTRSALATMTPEIKNKPALAKTSTSAPTDREPVSKTAAATTASLVASSSSTSERAKTPVWKKAWLWGVVGGVVAVGMGVGLGVGLGAQLHAPAGTDNAVRFQ